MAIMAIKAVILRAKKRCSFFLERCQSKSLRLDQRHYFDICSQNQELVLLVSRRSRLLQSGLSPLGAPAWARAGSLMVSPRSPSPCIRQNLFSNWSPTCSSMPNVADSNSFSPVPWSTITCSKGSAASARRFRTCALINSIGDVLLPESFLVCSLGLLNPVKHCRKDTFLHEQNRRAADSAARKCGQTLAVTLKLSPVFGWIPFDFRGSLLHG